MVITNPVEEIQLAIPTLATISNKAKNLEYVTYANWDSRLKRIETHNLKTYKRSTSWSSLNIYFNPCIIELRFNERVMVINREKFNLIRDHLRSETFNKV